MRIRMLALAPVAVVLTSCGLTAAPPSKDPVAIPTYVYATDSAVGRAVAPGSITPVMLHPCVNEDGTGGVLPCRWDDLVRTNGKGKSYAVVRTPVAGQPDRVTYFYDDGSVKYGDI